MEEQHFAQLGAFSPVNATTAACLSSSEQCSSEVSEHISEPALPSLAAVLCDVLPHYEVSIDVDAVEAFRLEIPIPNVKNPSSLHSTNGMKFELNSNRRVVKLHFGDSDMTSEPNVAGLVAVLALSAPIRPTRNKRNEKKDEILAEVSR